MFNAFATLVAVIPDASTAMLRKMTLRANGNAAGSSAGKALAVTGRP